MDNLTPDSVTPKPQPGLIKTIGILNIIFGGALLLCGLACLNPIAPAMVGGVPLQLEPETTQAAFDALRNEQIEFLRAQEKVAGTDAERNRLKKERLEVEAKHPQVKDEIDFPKINAEMNLSRLRTYLWLDLLGGPVLNLLLVFSGIGLILRKDWARLLAMAIAALKLLRLVALTALLVGSVIPHLSAALDSLLETDMGRQVIIRAVQRQQAQQGAPPGGPQPSPEEIAHAFRGVGTGFAIFVACFGSVYPIIVLILLSRPGARAATLGGESWPAEAPEF